MVNVVIVIVFLSNRNIAAIIASCGKMLCHPVKEFSALLINGLKVNTEMGIKSHKSFLCVFLISK